MKVLTKPAPAVEAPVPEIREHLSERFWSKVDRRGPADCWEWQAVRNAKGYGLIGKGGKYGGMLRAHRVSWELHNGTIPGGLVVRHRCDNPACVNPAHLGLGTHAQNSADMVERGRGTNKLTEQQVLEIRASDEPHAVLARRYGVTRPLIGQVKSGKTWAHLPGAHRAAPCRRLTDEQIRAIFQAEGLHQELAGRFSCSREMVGAIKRRVRHSHVTGDL